jgi:hypothetical protein
MSMISADGGGLSGFDDSVELLREAFLSALEEVPVLP